MLHPLLQGSEAYPVVPHIERRVHVLQERITNHPEPNTARPHDRTDAVLRAAADATEVEQARRDAEGLAAERERDVLRRGAREGVKAVTDGRGCVLAARDRGVELAHLRRVRDDERRASVDDRLHVLNGRCAIHRDGVELDLPVALQVRCQPRLSLEIR